MLPFKHLISGTVGRQMGKFRLSSLSSCRFCSTGDGDQNKGGKGVPEGQEGEGGSVKAEKTGRKARPPKPKADPVKAKQKLNDLLQTIVKEQENKKNEKAEDSAPEKKEEVAFRLARKDRKRMSPEEIAAAYEEKLKVKEVGKEMLEAVKKVAVAATAGEPEKAAEIESDLVKKLKSMSGQEKVDLGKLFEGMKIDKKAETDRKEEQARAPTMRERDLQTLSESAKLLGRRREGDRQGGRGVRLQERVDLFGAKPLGIFTKKGAEKEGPPISYLKTWDALYQKDLKLAVTHPPANGFEEMILWTEQGKLWKYPINNEQGLEESEGKSSFEEHIFLEPFIDPWCPKKGPIRHFMELVCIGLARNPYLSVDDKKEQLEWYHLYFKDKAKIIKEVGAGEIK